jgi:hypothetical protein
VRRQTWYRQSLGRKKPFCDVGRRWYGSADSLYQLPTTVTVSPKGVLDGTSTIVSKGPTEMAQRSVLCLPSRYLTIITYSRRYQHRTLAMTPFEPDYILCARYLRRRGGASIVCDAHFICRGGETWDGGRELRCRSLLWRMSEIFEKEHIIGYRQDILIVFGDVSTYHIIFPFTERPLYISTTMPFNATWVNSRPEVITQIHSLSQ